MITVATVTFGSPYPAMPDDSHYYITASYQWVDGVENSTGQATYIEIPFNALPREAEKTIRQALADAIYSNDSRTIDPDDIRLLGFFLS